MLKELGYGSTLSSGRWHTKGALQIVYSASSRALCQLEKRVHANGYALKNQALVQLELPPGAHLLTAVDLGLPTNWRNDMGATQKMGDDWLASRDSLGLWVPSFVEPGEFNLLINPQVAAFDKITLVVEREPFVFDPRMF
ncbi:RES family NAD+ phosphorylase [Hydrogenophaga defluvii]|uniref:RES family NAD+ phosphorylase n=1 Tax=Hydrogenophaga defluvii TaxID=249410 RepID=A0ABW2SFI8_9BURK